MSHPFADLPDARRGAAPRAPGGPQFLFATGIENSYPTIRDARGGRVRVDEMAKGGHYACWQTDFALVEEVGADVLRYGPPIHTTWLGDGRYDWAFADLTFAELRRRDITPIADLCHFGVPDWVGDFQNPDFPALFARYAGDFARRFPWVQFYTPVNEMYICATFSARYGWWNEQLATDRAFVTALKHLVRANVLAMHAILAVRPDAIFVQSESSEYFHAKNPAAIGPAERLNEIRFLSLDPNYGERVSSAQLRDVRVPARQRRDDARRVPLVLRPGAPAALPARERLLRDRRAPRPRGRRHGGLGGGVRLLRDHGAVLRALRAAHHAHRDQPRRGAERRRGRALAPEVVGQRAAREERRHPDSRVHLVLAHRPGGLGHGATRGPRPRQPTRPLRPRPADPSRGPRLPGAGPRLAPRAAGPEPRRHAPRLPAESPGHPLARDVRAYAGARAAERAAAAPSAPPHLTEYAP